MITIKIGHNQDPVGRYRN